MTFKEFVERVSKKNKGFFSVHIEYNTFDGLVVNIYTDKAAYSSNTMEECLSKLEGVPYIPEIEIDEKLFYPEGKE